MSDADTATAHDVRLAMPVAVAWAALAALSGNADAVRTAAAVAPVVAAVLLGIGGAVPRRLPMVRALAASAALAAGVAALVCGAGARVADADLADCGRLSLLVLGAGARPEAVVVGCDGRSLGVPAILARSPVAASEHAGSSQAPSAAADATGGDAPAGVAAEVVPGDVVAGECEVWLDGVQWLASCERAGVQRAAGAGAWIVALRAHLGAVGSRLPGDGSALLPGLAIGDTSRVDGSLDRSMLDAGLSHLTAVSGANCAVVVAGVLAVGAALRAPRVVRGILAVAALAGFVALVTPEASVVRAALMAAIAVLALVSGRPASGVALLAVAVVTALVVLPALATSPGFALSVLATAGLIVHARPLQRVLSRWLPNSLALLVAVPFAAQLWCLPVLVALDAGVSTVSIVANLLAGPAAPLATMLGLLACLAAPLAPAVALAIAWVGWVPSAWIGAVARVCAEAPFAVLPWPVAPWGVALALAAVAVVIVAHARGRLAAGAALASVVLACGVLVAAWPALRFRASLGSWTIAQCDVGQGSATIVRHGGATLVVDVGREPDRMEDCLAVLGVTHVTMLVLTHFDTDHAGGSAALVGRVDHVVHGPLDERALHTVRRFEAVGAVTEQAERGDAWRLGSDGGIVASALWPEGDVAPGNDASVALAIDAGADGTVDLVVLGDLGASTQARLRSAGVPRAPAIVVAHHGSADQHAALYEAIGASVALVGVGPNEYGHPTDEALAIVAESGGAALRTDELGTIAIDVQGTDVVVWSERRTERRRETLSRSSRYRCRRSSANMTRMPLGPRRYVSL